MVDINKIKFSADGLVPAVVQDYYTNQVLTVAYMNKESLEISLKEGRTCFFSRSRNELWRKGETSGNTQKIVSITADCDWDALVVKVIKKGPACHLGAESCFDNDIFREKNDFSVEGLYKLILERKGSDNSESYTNYLFREGVDKILKKIGEEATEVIIAAKNDDREEMIYEISDVCYHILVLMAEKGVEVSDIKEELASRHVIEKKNKQTTKGV